MTLLDQPKALEAMDGRGRGKRKQWKHRDTELRIALTYAIQQRLTKDSGQAAKVTQKLWPRAPGTIADALTAQRSTASELLKLIAPPDEDLNDLCNRLVSGDYVREGWPEGMYFRWLREWLDEWWIWQWSRPTVSCDGQNLSQGYEDWARAAVASSGHWTDDLAGFKQAPPRDSRPFG